MSADAHEPTFNVFGKVLSSSATVVAFNAFFKAR